MRLGSYECVLKPSSRARAIFEAERINERHRHRYEVNNNYIGTLERCGLLFSGMSPTASCRKSSKFPTTLGLSACSSIRAAALRPFEPHPLFASFIRAAVEQSRLV